MKVLIDTNVLIDYMTERPPFYIESKKIIDLCVESVIDGYIAAHSITDSFYIMRKYSPEEARELLSQMCEVMTVVGIDEAKLNAAIKNLDFDDIESSIGVCGGLRCGVHHHTKFKRF